MGAPANASRPEVWIGIEGTINRVGDTYHDQAAWSGHGRHWADDLERIAALGVDAIRYPVLWEAVAGERSWQWRRTDGPMHRLRTLGLRPIVGLLHHGSGPPSTDLLDPAFAAKFVAYARAAARRYPWVTDWTPINEPLTTARFSALYGHWYPHATSQSAMVRALLNQVGGIVAGMRAIREVVPDARLVQTEDTGRTMGVRGLARQVGFENRRRWLTYDLLFGRVTPDHPLWNWLVDNGAGVEELQLLAEQPCPPDVVGLNYYITSDRMLDTDFERCPAWSHGGNGVQRYADVEAVRASPRAILGHAAALRAAWERYGAPVAITEVHLGGPREEQLRWLDEAWRAACRARTVGIDARAVTVWSGLGAWDWNTLVTRPIGFYEPGPFDVRGPRRRPTALAAMTRALATMGSFEHPVLGDAGWWRRADRHWPEFRGAAARPARKRPILITGAGGTLGRSFTRLCAERGLAAVSLSRPDLDIASANSVAAALDRWRPWAVVNAAGYVRVDEAETDERACRRENAIGPMLLAGECARRGVSLLTFSTDLVFDGRHDRPFVESCRTAPMNAYGRSKLLAERMCLDALGSALVVRTSAFFGPWDAANFVVQAASALSGGRGLEAADDTLISPTYVPDLVQACLDLLVDGERGIWHLANRGATTWADLARRVARLVRADPSLVRGVPMTTMGLAAPRPRSSVLASERGRLMPSLDDALERWLVDREPMPSREQAESLPAA